MQLLQEIVRVIGEQLRAAASPLAAEQPATRKPARRPARRRATLPPPSDHPWRRNYQTIQVRLLNRELWK